MASQCDQCRTSIRGEGNRTSTRVLCDECYSQFTGLTAGYMSTGTVEGAISTAGWFDRVKKALKPGD